MATITLGSHERAAIVARLVAIEIALGQVPKDYRDPCTIERKLLKEKNSVNNRLGAS